MSFEVYTPPKKIPKYFEMIVVPNEHVDTLTIQPTEENGFNEMIPMIGSDSIFRLPVDVYDSDLWSVEQKQLLQTLCGGPSGGSAQELESDVFVGPAGFGNFDDLNEEQIVRLNEIQAGTRPGRIIGKRFFSTEMRKSR